MTFKKMSGCTIARQKLDTYYARFGHFIPHQTSSKLVWLCCISFKSGAINSKSDAVGSDYRLTWMTYNQHTHKWHADYGEKCRSVEVIDDGRNSISLWTKPGEQITLKTPSQLESINTARKQNKSRDFSYERLTKQQNVCQATIKNSPLYQTNNWN